MKCDSVRDLISDYLEGSIDYALWDSFRSHIDKCDSCKAEIAAIKSTWEVLDSLPEVETPVSFRHDVVMRAARIQHERSERRLHFPDLSGIFSRPLRAVGMVAAATAIALTMVRVTIPLNHFNAGMGGPVSMGSGNVATTDNESSIDENSELGQKQLWQSRHLGRNTIWINVSPNDKGNGRTIYRVLLSLNPGAVSKNTVFGRVWAQISLLPPDSYSADADQSKGLVWEGNILSTGPVLVPVIVDRFQGRREGVNLLVSWRFRGRQFSQIVYIPAHLGPDPSKDMYDLSGDLAKKSDPGLYSSLQRVSEEYGCIVVSPTGIRDDSPVVFVHGSTLDDTLRATLKPWKMDWLSCDHAIYVDREYPR
jgi:hypothetical protein